MTTNINDLILNTIPAQAEQVKKNQYQSSDITGFDKILDNVQNESRKVENNIKSNKSDDKNNIYAKDDSKDLSNKDVKSIDDDKYRKTDDRFSEKQDRKDKSDNVLSKDDKKEVLRKDSKEDIVKKDIVKEGTTNKVDDENIVDNKSKKDVVDTEKTDVSKDTQAAVKTNEDNVINAEVLTEEVSSVVVPQETTEVITEDSQDTEETSDKADNTAVDKQKQSTSVAVDTTLIDANAKAVVEDVKTTPLKDNLPPINTDYLKEALNSDKNSTKTVSSNDNATTVDNNVDLTDSTQKQNFDAKIKDIKEVAKDVVKEVISDVLLDKNEIKDAVLPTETPIVEEISTPLIKVSDETKVESSKVIDSKDTDDLKDKILEQNLLTELDAEVSSGGQNTFNNNFAGQQNAAEQVVKLSIEPSLSNADAVDFSNLVNQKSSSQGLGKAQFNPNPLPTGELNKSDVLNQINDKLNSLKTSTGEKIEIILKPENLGKVNVEIQNIKGVITATLIAENPQVKEVLEKNLDILKSNLNGQGVNLNTVTVKVEEPDKSAFNNFNLNQEQSEKDFNQQQKNSQKAYYDGYEDSKNWGNTELETDEIGNSNDNLKSQSSLHVGSVDYKV